MYISLITQCLFEIQRSIVIIVNSTSSKTIYNNNILLLLMYANRRNQSKLELLTDFNLNERETFILTLVTDSS